jgi:2-methylcitrate dehydratase PrpD
LDQIREWEGTQESTVAVFGDKVPAHLAAFANGTMARALEIADVYDGFPLHPSSSTVPVALAMAERQGNVTGKEFITAIALGHDLIVRMALATKIDPIRSGRYNLFKIFPPTGTAGRLLGLDEERLSNAMGVAFTQMVGDGQSALDGAMTHYLQQGVVAQSAIECALLAEKGITGARNILEGRFGLFNAYEPDPDMEALARDLGKVFRGVDISVKLYSSCRATHEAIDLALEITREEGIQHGHIERITVRINEPTYNLCCLNRKSHPETEVDAQFSLPYCVAAAIVRKDVFVDELKEDAFTDPAVTGLAERVQPTVDPERRTHLVIGSTVMEIETRDGRVFSRETRFPIGNPENPVSFEDCVRKFKKCTAYSARPFNQAQIEETIAFIGNLEQVKDVAPLAGLLVPRL